MARAFEEVIRLVFESQGLEGVGEFGQELDQLGDAGDATREQLQELADALARAADLQGNISAYREVGASLRQLDADQREAMQGVRDLAAAQKASADVVAEKRAALADAEKQQRAYLDGSHALIGSTNQIAAAQRATRDEVSRLTAEVREAERANTADGRALDAAREALARTSTQRNRALDQLREYGNTLKTAGVDVTRLAGEERRLAEQAAATGAEAQQLIQTTREAAAAWREKAAGADEAGKATAGVTEVLSRSKAALAAAAASLYGVRRALGAAAGESSAFQSAMAQVNTQLDDASKLDEITRSVRALAREFGSDAAENARALYETMAVGGADAAESLELLAEANRLAIAGGADLVETAKLIRAGIAAYGADVREAGRFSDSFFQGLRAGNLSLGELAQNFARVAPFAAQAGVSVDEINTALATLTTGGVQANEATTSLVALLNAVVNPSRQAARTAEDLGLEFNLASLRAKGLAGFIAEVTRATDGNEQAMARLFGSTNALNGVLQLGGSLSEDYAKNLDAAAEAAGRVTEAFDKVADTPEQRMRRFEAAMRDLRITLGEVVTSLTPILDGLTGLVNGFNSLPGPVRTGTAALVALAGVAGSLVLTVKALTPALKVLGLALPSIGTSATGALAGVAKLGIALKGLGATMALGFAVDKVTEAYTALRDLAQVNRDVAEAERDLRSAQLDQRLRIEQLKEAYAGLADTTVRANDELREMTTADLGPYLRNLENAGRYWRAIEIEAKAVGNEQTRAFARERADDFASAIDGVHSRLKDLRAALDAIEKKAEAFADIVENLDAASGSAADLTKRLDEAFKDRNFKTTADEVGQIALALAQVGARASESERQVREGLTESLRRLSGRDLLSFRDAAVRAFDEVGGRAGDTALVLNTVLTAALESLGLSAQAAGRATTAAGEDAIAAFRLVSESAEASAEQVEMAFQAALARLATAEEAEALGDALRAAADEGRIGAEALERSLAAIQRRVGELQEAARPLAAAFAELGIKSQAELQRAADAARDAFETVVAGARNGEAAQEDLARAFEAYAAAQRAAVADSNEAAKAQVEAKLRARAAALGLRDALNEVGRAGAEMGERVAAGANTARDALDRATDSAHQLGGGGREAAAGLREASRAASEGVTIFQQFTTSVVDSAEGLTYGRDAAWAWQRTVGGFKQTAFAVKSGFDAIGASASAASREVEALTRQLEEARLQQQGNDAELERRRQRDQVERIRQLEEQARIAGDYDAARFAELRRLAEDFHKERIRQIEDQATIERTRRSGAARRSTGFDSGSTGPQRIELRVSGQIVGLDPQGRVDPTAARRLGMEILRQIARGGAISR